MKKLGEKQLAVLAAIAFGSMVYWLIASDTSMPPPDNGKVVVMAATAAAPASRFSQAPR